MNSATIDRAVGAVMASAAGDALGAPYEFGPPNPSAPCAMEGGGGHRWEPGEWTDDTQMALSVLTVLATGSTDVAAIGEEMVRWYRSRPRDVGIQTAGVLSEVGGRYETAAESAAAYQAERPNAAGNGALMRTASGCARPSRRPGRGGHAGRGSGGAHPPPSGQRPRLRHVVARDRAGDHDSVPR